MGFGISTPAIGLNQLRVETKNNRIGHRYTSQWIALKLGDERQLVKRVKRQLARRSNHSVLARRESKWHYRVAVRPSPPYKVVHAFILPRCSVGAIEETWRITYLINMQRGNHRLSYYYRMGPLWQVRAHCQLCPGSTGSLKLHCNQRHLSGPGGEKVQAVGLEG